MDALLALLLTGPVVAYEGWAIATLWRWFIVSHFHCVPLTIPAAVGISLLMSLTAHQPYWGKEDEKYTVLAKLFTGAAITTIILGWGWLAHFFV